MTRRFFTLFLTALGVPSVLRAIASVTGHDGVLRAFAAQENSGNTTADGPVASFSPENSRRAIESVAVGARTGDPTAVSLLVDAVFDYPRSYPRLPASLEGPVKRRIANAEVSYRQGQSAGVQTADLISTWNGLADKFSLPDYAKTSVIQVRHIRIWQAAVFPNLMGEGLSRPEAKIGDPISDTMSPTQAVHSALVLANQKLVDPDYQVPPDKWDPRISVHSQPVAGHAASGRIDIKGQALRRALEAATSGMTAADAQQTLNDGLGGLGI